MGEAKIPFYAYVDESGNSGKNIFDPAQPDYFTAALINKGRFDLRYTEHVKAIAAKVGSTSIHANRLGLSRLEQIADDLGELLLSAGSHFFLCRVEKRYLLASKTFDVLFDSGENAAIAWHNYNFRMSRVILAFKLAHITDDEIAHKFWNCLLMLRERDARAAIPAVCESLKARLHLLPDQRSRDVLGEGLDWIIKHPDCVQFATEQKIVKKGHLPNLVAFTNLLKGLEEISARSRKRVACITHDEQTEFRKTFEFSHELFSNASSEVIEWAGERYSLRCVAGSRFEMRRDDESVGIQMADVALGLYGQALKGKDIPRNCGRLLLLMLSRGWHNDFSFGGVEKQLLENYGDVLFGPIEPERLEAAQRMLAIAEERRRLSMEQYEVDGLPPFMRSISIAEKPAIEP
jgi:hypothetical protein